MQRFGGFFFKIPCGLVVFYNRGNVKNIEAVFCNIVSDNLYINTERISFGVTFPSQKAQKRFICSNLTVVHRSPTEKLILNYIQECKGRSVLPALKMIPVL